ncbi:hypothetical protein OG21DRAFT_165877 [Imleria badia]|nr:hypothetical protein OG21DRAFT_165877 [Imleria badia]
MLLDPAQKSNHIRMHWGEELLTDAILHAEEMYKERYNTLYGNNAHSSQATGNGQKVTSHGRKLNTLVQLSSDEDSDTEVSPRRTDVGRQWRDPAKPWLQGFHEYLQTHENMGDLSIVQWWGINAVRYPVWASLARDYLSVMQATQLPQGRHCGSLAMYEMSVEKRSALSRRSVARIGNTIHGVTRGD